MYNTLRVQSLYKLWMGNNLINNSNNPKHGNTNTNLWKTSRNQNWS